MSSIPETAQPAQPAAPAGGPRSTAAEALFISWNIPFQLVELAITDVHVIKDAQVRNVENVAPTESVESYANQIRAGAEFPPIVVREGGILVDGYTRTQGHRRAGRTAIWAYVIKVPSNDMAKAVAGALNQMGGQRLSAAEAQQNALVMLEELGFTDDQVAMYLGRTGQQVRNWRRQAETTARADRLGLVKEINRVSANMRDQIASVTHDEPFAATVRLVSDIKPNKTELTALIKGIKEATSDAAALELINHTRADWTPQGPEPRSVQINTKARQARRVIPQLLHMPPVEVFDPDKADADLEMWEKLAAHVTQVVGILRLRREELVTTTPAALAAQVAGAA
jgi:hypothetical protein